MGLATRANLRVAAAAASSERRRARPCKIAFRTGGVVGFLTVGLGLLGASSVVLIYKGDAPTVLEGFGFGAALLAMFIRVGGGIFTKAADVGADLVGKVEQGIPEDDPRNAATIADNVGDNVGDCAGMAADLFESYAVMLVAALILGKAAFGEEGLVFPLIVPAIGAITAIIGVFLTRLRPTDRNGMQAINRAFFTSAAISAVLCAIAAFVYLPSKLSDLDEPSPTGDRRRRRRPRPAPDRHRRRDHRHRARVDDPAAHRLLHRERARARCRTSCAPRSPARPPSSCPASRSASSRPSTPRCSSAPPCSAPTCSAAARSSSACSASRSPAPACSPRSASSSRWTPSARSRTTPRASPRCPATSTRPAPGCSPTSTRSATPPRRSPRASRSRPPCSRRPRCSARSPTRSRARSLDTGAELDGSVRNLQYTGVLNVSDPKNLVGLIIGASVVFMFSGLAINAVTRAAGAIVFEVRRQFREIPGIMEGTGKPEYGKVVDICTRDSLRELATPGLLAVLAPIAVGFGLGVGALGPTSPARSRAGTLMAILLANSGGAWDNAKKIVEDGAYGGKGSPAHEATVIGDTVGDPFKDTAGPAINPLIKVMNLVVAADRPGHRVAVASATTPATALRILIALVARRGHRRRGLRLQAPQHRGRRGEGRSRPRPGLTVPPRCDRPRGRAVP